MRSNNALTLVEVMVTLAVVGILATASLAVLGNLSRVERNDKLADANSALDVNLQELLRIDLQHASLYKITSRGFALQQSCRLNAQTFEIEHMSAEIYFEIKQIENTYWLVRQQVVDEIKQPAALICRDIKQLQFESLNQDDQQPRPDEWYKIANLTKVTFEFSDPKRAKIFLQFPTGAMN